MGRVGECALLNITCADMLLIEQVCVVSKLYMHFLNVFEKILEFGVSE